MEYNEILTAIDTNDTAKLQQIVTADEININVTFVSCQLYIHAWNCSTNSYRFYDLLQEWTPLLAAVCCRRVPIVQLLLSIGADPNVGDNVRAKITCICGTWIANKYQQA